MKAKKNIYETPKIEIVEIEIQAVLCGSPSPMGGNSTEPVGTDYFGIG